MHGRGFAGMWRERVRERWRWEYCKASVDEARRKAKMWWPHLERTETKAIVRRPRSGSRWGFAKFMAVKLPQFRFNNKQDWWEAGLEELGRAEDALKPVRLSDGAREYLNEEEIC